MDQQQAVLQNILTRRSVRKYQKKPIPHDVLEKILEAGFGRLAPATARLGISL